MYAIPKLYGNHENIHISAFSWTFCIISNKKKLKYENISPIHFGHLLAMNTNFKGVSGSEFDSISQLVRKCRNIEIYWSFFNSGFFLMHYKNIEYHSIALEMESWSVDREERFDHEIVKLYVNVPKTDFFSPTLFL